MLDRIQRALQIDLVGKGVFHTVALAVVNLNADDNTELAETSLNHSQYSAPPRGCQEEAMFEHQS